MKKPPRYTFSSSEDLIHAIGFPDGCTIVFSNSDWNFSFDENNHLIAKNALGSKLYLEVYGNTQAFQEKFQGLFEKHNKRSAY
ncbi:MULTISPECIES: hypothetical protein [unclassified Bartonella]|uniref:hypothetical protein n=1 Tax=unclassified Bartonella TaxID=2645622 RepID=UPI0035CF55DD